MTLAMGEQGLTKYSLRFQSGKKNPFLGLFNSLLLPELLDLENSLTLGHWTGESTAFQEALSVGVPLLGSGTICKFAAAADEFKLS